MDGRKPLGKPSYGSIPHLPGSRVGPGDHMCHAGQARIATEKARDKHDFVIVQEKVDGSNVGIARINGEIVPLTRAGYVANTSPFEQHHLFHRWALDNVRSFTELLADGERLCGEWMVQAHGTIYGLLPSPLLAFDIMRGTLRIPWREFEARLFHSNPPVSYIPAVHKGAPLSIESAMQAIGTYGSFGSLGAPEGVVWRVERKGEVDFLVKYVRPDKQDGIYLPEVSGGDTVWNWKL